MRILTILLFAIIILSCGNKKEQKPFKNKVEKTVQTPADNAKEIKLVINSDDKMMFDKRQLRAKAGQKVTLTLNHKGKMAKTAMGHNWVLLKKGIKISSFANKAMSAVKNDYIPNDGSVIAHTKLIGGGESTTITFTAPEKGTYDYMCSFPGHYAIMKGKFIVE